MAKINREPTPVTEKTTPITLLLQWLAYAFWGWFALSMIWLAAMTIGYYIDNQAVSYDYNFFAYPIAASITLCIVASVTDWLYSKSEPEHKTGYEVPIMVIHGVIFALIGIGAFVVALIAAINLLINIGTDSTGGKLTVILSAIVGLALFLILAVRVTLVHKIPKIGIISRILLISAMVLFVALAAIGPIKMSIETRGDRKIESALPEISESISAYTRDNHKLPRILSDVRLSSPNAIKVVEDGLVDYKPLDKKHEIDIKVGNVDTPETYYYKLCANFKGERGGLDYMPGGEGGYLTYIYSGSHHPKGYYCYNLKIEDYFNRF